AGQSDIGDELAVATKETRIFLALQPRPDPAVGFMMGGHYVGVPVRICFVARAWPDTSEYLEGVNCGSGTARLSRSAVPQTTDTVAAVPKYPSCRHTRL